MAELTAVGAPTSAVDPDVDSRCLATRGLRRHHPWTLSATASMRMVLDRPVAAYWIAWEGDGVRTFSEVGAPLGIVIA